MKAIWRDKVIAESPKEDLIYIEGNWYFPPASVQQAFLHESDTPYTCPWKGECTYFNVGEGDNSSPDSAWAYKNPKPSAIEQVKKDFTDYVAFWHDIQVSE